MLGENLEKEWWKLWPTSSRVLRHAKFVEVEIDALIDVQGGRCRQFGFDINLMHFNVGSWVLVVVVPWIDIDTSEHAWEKRSAGLS